LFTTTLLLAVRPTSRDNAHDNRPFTVDIFPCMRDNPRKRTFDGADRPPTPLTVLDQFDRRQGTREHPRGEFEADTMLA
jgi:hypothetical protein